MCVCVSVMNVLLNLGHHTNGLSRSQTTPRDNTRVVPTNDQARKYEVWPEPRELLEASCDMGGRSSGEMTEEFGPHLDFGHLPAVWWCVDGIGMGIGASVPCGIGGRAPPSARWLFVGRKPPRLSTATTHKPRPSLLPSFLSSCARRYVSGDCDPKDPEQCRHVFRTQGYIEPYGTSGPLAWQE